MKPICYKHTESGECYKFVFDEGLPQKDIDDILDVVSGEGIEFIQEDEFNNKYDKLMTLDVMEGSGKYRIGVLSTKWLDLEAIEDEELANIINH